MKRNILISLLCIITLFVTGCDKRNEILKNNINTNCENYTSYLNKSVGGGSGPSATIIDVGICDSVWTSHSIVSDSFKAMKDEDYIKTEYEFNNNDIINAIYKESLYYVYHNNANDSFRLNILMSGSVCDSMDNNVIKMAKELQKEYGNVTILATYTNDKNFNNDDYYKATFIGKGIIGSEANGKKVNIKDEGFILMLELENSETKIIEKFNESRARALENYCK